MDLTPEEQKIFDLQKSEAVRQIQLAQKATEEKAQQQINLVKTTGAVGAEQQRILDIFGGNQGSGKAAGEQIRLAVGTDRQVGQLENALTQARAGFAGQTATVENQIAQAIENLKREKAAALIKVQQDAAEKAADRAYSENWWYEQEGVRQANKGKKATDMLSPSLLGTSALQQFGAKAYDDFGNIDYSIPAENKTAAYNYLYNEAVKKGYSQTDFEETLIKAGLSGYNPQVAQEKAQQSAFDTLSANADAELNRKTSYNQDYLKLSNIKALISNAYDSGAITEEQATQLFLKYGINTMPTTTEAPEPDYNFGW